MDNKFTWTQEFRRSWEDNLKDITKKTSNSISNDTYTRRNIIRHLLLAIDTSVSVEKVDYLPSIRSVLADHIPKFEEAFRMHNPLSLMTFITCTDVIEKYSKEFRPDTMLNTIGSGDFSLLNCLKGIVEISKNTKFNREALLILSSINTKDSGCYEEVIKHLKKLNIKVSIISICGEVTFFKKLTILTDGMFFVPLDRSHFELILELFTKPLRSSDPVNMLVKYGFPASIFKQKICNCHLLFKETLNECPFCHALVCNIPIQCPVCNLQLISPINISKSYYYVFPQKPFTKIDFGECEYCRSTGTFQCEDCLKCYCNDCELFIREYLNFCIYCNNYKS